MSIEIIDIYKKKIKAFKHERLLDILKKIDSLFFTEFMVGFAPK